VGEKYALSVKQMVNDLKRGGHDVSAFIVESLPGVAGQIVLPEGYLKSAFQSVRQAGGVCVADEVQVGFGRVGTHFWGFETQGVVPDIVTLGKPIGNGHPIGAVVTTPEIAEAFHNGMEYFNTFGGNPVSCAIGLSVLDVIEDENLQSNALHVGRRFTQGLEGLKSKLEIIGDVRGLGLYLGVELVTDRQTLAPAAKEATLVIEHMKEKGILMSTDGPLHNVIKLKPPIVFSEENADFVVDHLAIVIAEIQQQMK
jgi:4-aminobutyrate aminotransferase-like enzyme